MGITITATTVIMVPEWRQIQAEKVEPADLILFSFVAGGNLQSFTSSGVGDIMEPVLQVQQQVSFMAEWTELQIKLLQLRWECTVRSALVFVYC